MAEQGSTTGGPARIQADWGAADLGGGNQEAGAATLTPAGLGSRALPGGSQGRLRALVVGVVFVGILAVVYRGILRDLVRQWWDDENYSHGFLVPLFSGYLIWQRRERLGTLTAEGSWAGLLVLLGGVGALLLGDLGGENFLTRSSLIVVLAGLILFHLGWRFFRALAFPLLFLFFAVPLPSTLFYAVAFPLQTLAARNAAWVLDLLGVPVLLDGNIINLSQISLGVTEACSGIRSLISLLAVAVAWGAVTLTGFWGQALLVASAVPITVVANAGRVVATGFIGQWLGVEYARGFFHTFSGWVIFLLAFACLLGVQSAIRFAQMRQRGRAS